MRRIRALAAVFLACVLAVSGVVAPLGAVAFAQPAAAQDEVQGMVGVPSSQIQDDVPSSILDLSGGDPDVEAFRGEVMTDAHAETLDVSVTTEAAVEGRASECGGLTAPDYCSDPKVALVLTDDYNHDGRHVSVPVQPVRDSLGYVPDAAYIDHSSGDEYTARVERQGDRLIFWVPKFSENTVTFSGELQIQGNPASDGAQYNYDVQNSSTTDNYSIDVTGRLASAWSNESGRTVSQSPSTIDVGGNQAPTGPSANGKPVVEVTGAKSHYDSDYKNSSTSGNLYSAASGYEVYYSAVDGPMGATEFKASGAMSATVDVYVNHEGGADGTYGEGTLVASGVDWSTGGAGWTKQPWNGTYDPDGQQTVVEIVVQSGSVDFETDTDACEYSSAWTRDGANPDNCQEPVGGVAGQPGLGTTTVSANDGTSATVGDTSVGTTSSAEFPLSTSATDLTVEAPGGGTLDYTLKVEENTVTEDPTVEVNGNTTSYTGTLSEGSTASLTTDLAWIQDGTNRVNVTMTAPASGPTPQVGLDYRHDTKYKKTVQYEGETWTERYNVSKTYANDRNGETLRIPFASDRVVAVRDLEMRTNGGSWSNIPESDRSFDGSELVANIGTVQSGDTVEVRANASKVRARNGEITVLEPTVEGDKMATKVELSAWSSDAYIDVSGTHPADNLHYAVNKSWTDPQDYARVTSSGQELYFPSASSGSKARIETLPLEVRPSGDVEVRVKSGGFEPRFKVSPGSTTSDDVEWYYKHPDLQTGENYVLYSVSGDKVVDQQEANSPISLFSGDESQTLEIFHDDTNTSSSGSGGGFWQDAESSARDFAPVIDPKILLFVVLASISGGFAYSERRTPGRALWKRPAAVLGLGAGVIVALLFLAPSAVAQPVQTALQAALPLLALVIVGTIALTAYGWYKAKQKASEPATIQVMGRQK